jgi:hypothetical protein
VLEGRRSGKIRVTVTLGAVVEKIIVDKKALSSRPEGSEATEVEGPAFLRTQAPTST